MEHQNTVCRIILVDMHEGTSARTLLLTDEDASLEFFQNHEFREIWVQPHCRPHLQEEWDANSLLIKLVQVIVSTQSTTLKDKMDSIFDAIEKNINNPEFVDEKYNVAMKMGLNEK